MYLPHEAQNMIMKTKHANIIYVYIKACKQKEFRDSYQTKELYSESPKHGGCPTKPP